MFCFDGKNFAKNTKTAANIRSAVDIKMSQIVPGTIFFGAKLKLLPRDLGVAYRGSSLV